MIRIGRYISALSLLLLSLPLAEAQSSVDASIGLGTAHAKSSGLGIDNINSANAFGSCALGSGDPNCAATPSLGGFFLGFNGNIMMSKRFGVGGEVNLQPGKSDYAGLQFRQLFYDFNGIYAPVSHKRAILQLQGGIGGAKTSYSYTQSSCVGTAVCSTFSQAVGNSNHFQLHAGAGVQLFLTDHIFIRPQFDLHYVPNFTDQFGSNVVPAATVWIGYSIGER